MEGKKKKRKKKDHNKNWALNPQPPRSARNFVVKTDQNKDPPTTALSRLNSKTIPLLVSGRLGKQSEKAPGKDVRKNKQKLNHLDYVRAGPQHMKSSSNFTPTASCSFFLCKYNTDMFRNPRKSANSPQKRTVESTTNYRHAAIQPTKTSC